MNLTASTLAKLRDHAAAEYPRECCGMIHQSGRVRRCRNIDPRPNRFEFTAADVLVLFESQSTADPITTIYHSHPDAPAISSLADRAGARAIGEPLMGRLTWLIVECSEVRPLRMVSFKWHPFTAAAADWTNPNARSHPQKEPVRGAFHRTNEWVIDGKANVHQQSRRPESNYRNNNKLGVCIGKTPHPHLMA